MVNLEQVSKPIQRTRNLPSAGEDIHEDVLEDVLVALRQIIHATDLHSKRVSRESGLTIPQIVVLKSVRDLGEVTTSAISRQVSLS